jgi:hypothetical protein
MRGSFGRREVLAALGAVTFLAQGALAPAAEESSKSTFFHRARNLFAVVDADGTLVSGNNVDSVTHLATGQYEVVFNRNVSRCAYIATTKNAYSQAMQAYTAGGHTSDRGVYVETKNQGGGLQDGPFNLVVACGDFWSPFAVVGYGGELVRASYGTRLTVLGAGRYELRFPWFTDVEGCAYLATVGDPNDELVFSPSGVYTGSGPDRRTVYIETKNPAGGLRDGVPFHLAVLCPSRLKTLVAVVGADGISVRGDASLSSFRSATGKYTLVTNKDVSGCATVATRGSVDDAVPYSPTTLEIVPGPAPNTVGIDERTLLFFANDPFDEAFHAAIVCK